MLKTIAIILAVLWLIGMLAHVAGGFIHFLILAALIILAYDLLVGRRRAHM
jgi:predicted membrane metal-binding protein